MSASKILQFPKYMTTREAAEYLHVSKSFLEKKRCTGGGPDFMKVGGGVRYRIDHLDAYMDGLTFSNTSQVSTAKAA